MLLSTCIKEVSLGFINESNCSSFWFVNWEQHCCLRCWEWAMTEWSTINKAIHLKGLGSILEEKAERMLELEVKNGCEMPWHNHDSISLRTTAVTFRGPTCIGLDCPQSVMEELIVSYLSLLNLWWPKDFMIGSIIILNCLFTGDAKVPIGNSKLMVTHLT